MTTIFECKHGKVFRHDDGDTEARSNDMGKLAMALAVELERLRADADKREHTIERLLEKVDELEYTLDDKETAHQETLKTLKMLKILKDSRRWIPVGELLPEEHDAVLIATVYGEASVVVRRGHQWWTDDAWFELDEVTHWQTIPERPKENQ